METLRCTAETEGLPTIKYIIRFSVSVLQSHEYDVPLYFRFLTIMAFQIFFEEKVDVAIIEVGIGGEYDCTNILRYDKVG